MYLCSIMSVERFKRELSELLQRFVATDCIATDENNSADGAPLTSQKIIEAVQEVFCMILNVDLVGLMREQAAKPTSGMVMTIPDGPDVPKQNVCRNGAVAKSNRSLDRLWTERLMNPTIDKPSIVEPSSSHFKVNDNIVTIKEADSRAINRKLKPKSSPDGTTLIRSGTFVRESTSESSEDGDIFEKNNARSRTMRGGSEYSEKDLPEILKKLKILRESATDVVNKIDDINEEVVPVNIQPIRRWSGLNRTSIAEEAVAQKIEEMILDVSGYRPDRGLSDGCYSGLSRAKLPEKSIVRPKTIRRSIPATFPQISTILHSGLNESEPENVSVTRKSTSTTNIEGSNPPIPSTSRSISSSSLTLSKKSVTRYSSPGNGSQALDVNTRKKSSLRSPSLSSLNLKSHTVGNLPRNRMHIPAQTVKAAIGLGNRKTY